MKIENPNSISPLPEGYNLASNTICKLLGQGETGATYVVTDVRAEGGYSALKECLPSGHAFREGKSMQLLPVEATGTGVELLRTDLEAFISEANALETIHHPSVVAVSRVFTAKGTAYITMELLRGMTLAEWVAQNGPPSKEQLVYLLGSLLSALACLHSHGIAHRDIREENVRFRESGVPVLVDFGEARKTILNGGGSNELSSLKKSAEDLFALGAMARRLITGEKGTPSGRVAPLAKNGRYVPTYGKSLLAGIDKAMDTNEGKGWADAEEWQDAVKGRLLSASGRRLFRQIGIGVAAVGVLSVGAYFMVQRWVAEDPASKVHVPTQEELAAQAYEEGVQLLTDGPDHMADPYKAIPLLKKASGLGHRDAAWQLVKCYTGDKLAEPDPEEAFHWCSKAAQTGNHEAEYMLACMYAQGIGTEKDTKAAVPYLLKAAESGMAGAQYDLAMSYATGDAGRQDLAEATRWFTAAGNQGHVQAQMELGRRYREGQAGITYTNFQDSFNWYQKAAQAGEPEAWYHLGLAYWDGQGTKQDRTEAERCFRRAAELGVAKAAAKIGIGISRGIIPGKMEEAEEFLKQASDQGETDAQLALAELYVRGVNGKRNEAAALPYYLDAAKNNNAEATCSLAELWLSGFRGDCTEDTLRDLLTKAAETSSRAKLYSALLPGTPRDQAIQRLQELTTGADDNAVKADAWAYWGLFSDIPGIAMDRYNEAAKKGSPLGEALVSYASLMDGAQGAKAADDLRILTRGADSREPYRAVLLSALGEVYLKGKGTPQDVAKGVRFLEKAAELGDIGALDLLAASYWEGANGLEQDKAKALETYRREAAAGSPKAAAFLGHYHFTGEDSTPDRAAAEPYLAAASKSGDARSMYEYAACLREKPEQAAATAEWAQKAMEAGWEAAALLLCELHLDGHGVDQDAAQARQFLTRYLESVSGKPAPAAAAAWDRLGTMYAEGTGTEKDEKKARECWSKAADAKNPSGQFHYGKLLHTSSKKAEKDRGKTLILAAADAGLQEAVEYAEKKELRKQSSSSSSNKGSNNKGRKGRR